MVMEWNFCYSIGKAQHKLNALFLLDGIQLLFFFWGGGEHQETIKPSHTM